MRNSLPNSRIVGLRTTYLINECKNLIILCTLKLYEYHDYGSIEICTKSLTWKLFLFFSQCKENSIYKYDLIKTTKNIFRNNICAKSKGKDCTYRISNFTIYLDNKIYRYAEVKRKWYRNKYIKYRITSLEWDVFINYWAVMIYYGHNKRIHAKMSCVISFWQQLYLKIDL